MAECTMTKMIIANSNLIMTQAKSFSWVLELFSLSKLVLKELLFFFTFYDHRGAPGNGFQIVLSHNLNQNLSSFCLFISKPGPKLNLFQFLDLPRGRAHLVKLLFRYSCQYDMSVYSSLDKTFFQQLLPAWIKLQFVCH